jgi:hypothetical protein
MMTLQEIEQQRPLTIPVKDAAEVMGVTPLFLRNALLQGRFPFGVGVEVGRNEFYINTNRFIKYMKCE